MLLVAIILAGCTNRVDRNTITPVSYETIKYKKKKTLKSSSKIKVKKVAKYRKTLKKKYNKKLKVHKLPLSKMAHFKYNNNLYSHSILDNKLLITKKRPLKKHKIKKSHIVKKAKIKNIKRVAKKRLKTKKRQKKLLLTATAYTSHKNQTDSTPFLAAWNNKIKPGMKIVAVSHDLIKKYGLKNGTKVKIKGLKGLYVVKDKMHKRFKKRIDIYMGLNKKKALQWGKRKVVLYY